MDEETERTLQNIARNAEIQRKASDSAIESAQVPEALARQIALAQQFAESPTIKSAQRLAEQANTHVANILGDTPSRLILGDTPSRLQEIIEQSNRSADRLRSMLPSEEQISRATDSLARKHTPLPALIPRPEIEAAYVIQEHLPALVELQAKSLEQTAAVATIAQAQLEIASH